MALPAPQTIAFAVRGPIARSDLPGLCDRVCDLFGQTRPEVALCDVSGVEPDAVTVDALARLQLAARRYRCRVRLRNATDDLLELVAFMGLTDVLPDGGVASTVVPEDPSGGPESADDQRRNDGRDRVQEDLRQPRSR